MNHEIILSIISFLSTALFAFVILRMIYDSRRDHEERRLVEREKARIHEAATAFYGRETNRLVEIFREMETDTGRAAVQSFISILTK